AAKGTAGGGAAAGTTRGRLTTRRDASTAPVAVPIPVEGGFVRGWQERVSSTPCCPRRGHPTGHAHPRARRGEGGGGGSGGRAKREGEGKGEENDESDGGERESPAAPIAEETVGERRERG